MQSRDSLRLLQIFESCCAMLECHSSKHLVSTSPHLLGKILDLMPDLVKGGSGSLF